MITRRYGNLALREEPTPAASIQLEKLGYAHIPAVLTGEPLDALREQIAEVFDTSEADRPHDEFGEFRHGMLNRSGLAQAAIGLPAILEAIEPLLGEDCHVIANTAWRNRRGHEGGRWHTDAGPHVPRPEGVAWPDAIPYPVFAIGMHLFLEDCPLEAGPTAVLPGSHRSGRGVPFDRINDPNLTYENHEAVLLPAKAGDAIFFVSDIWHRGTPAQEGRGRFFLQAHYARRDIAQRIQTTDEVNHLTPEAIARATTKRERKLAGLHRMGFYDA
ncbi:MAG TPA: phytanoyl-CoA dioxygenase family protein [Caulobacteraceae bacterium]|jgi:ectoine hydroxylase-related dioxygenase (phytanoyl-CoA dioxygenase family)|nr:phytanoyl-CoA dioxygenase family protein [Caulobacteraceae bacterium]